MSVFFYNIFLLLFKAGIRIASLFNSKARKWVNGRKNIFERLSNAIPEGSELVWVHCASLGEFEQGRPVIEKLKITYPGYKILLTFFSPSGYEVQQNFKGADWVFYLPMDGPRNAKRFLAITKPRLVIFVKYEFWFYYLKKISYRNIPLILISALFRKDMSFFKWHGALQRKMLTRFNHLFVQNNRSKELLDEIGIADHVSISGDTRFDRVIEIAEQMKPIAVIEEFAGNKKLVIAGSTWKPDEELLFQSLPFFKKHHLKLVIAPHETGKKHIQELRELFPDARLFSSFGDTPLHDAPVLIIDSIGLLSQLYAYAFITYVGGGFNRSGIHNVLEAAVFNKPVFFGPFYQKYVEAIELVNRKGGFAVKDGKEMEDLVTSCLKDPQYYSTIAENAGNYVKESGGAVTKIISFIQEKRLLTN